jgi:hypothetical protein
VSPSFLEKLATYGEVIPITAKESLKPLNKVDVVGGGQNGRRLIRYRARCGSEGFAALQP